MTTTLLASLNDMTLAQDLSSQFKARILPALPAPIQGLFGGGSRKHLFSQVNQRFLLFNDSLINLDSGQSTVIEASGKDLPARELAAAAKKLAASETLTGVMLYLQPSEFVATSLTMPGLDRELLLSALQLQVDNLFPSFSEKLAVTLGSDSKDSDEAPIALWFPENLMNQLFDEFAAAQLFLVAIAPRIALDSASAAIIDYDQNGGTLVQFSQGAVVNWLHINQFDMLDESLNQQWVSTLAGLQVNPLTLDSPANFTQFKNALPSQDYAFVPNGALQARRREEKSRNIKLAAVSAVVLMFLAAIPFLLQTIQFRSLASTLADYRAQSTGAREDQSVVVNFENQWGIITDFPVQDVQEAMFTLQTILLPDQLASLELNQGLIKIQGTSSEPQAILQRLEQDPMFTEVVFSRATNNSRYYIDLRLSTVNFEGYMVRYFPDE
jgi:hypothetical protein